MKFTRYEKARILGARALQIAMGAPIMVKIPSEDIIDPIQIALIEQETGQIPITVARKT